MESRRPGTGLEGFQEAFHNRRLFNIVRFLI